MQDSKDNRVNIRFQRNTFERWNSVKAVLGNRLTHNQMANLLLDAFESNKNLDASLDRKTDEQSEPSKQQVSVITDTTVETFEPSSNSEAANNAGLISRNSLPISAISGIGGFDSTTLTASEFERNINLVENTPTKDIPENCNLEPIAIASSTVVKQVSERDVESITHNVISMAPLGDKLSKPLNESSILSKMRDANPSLGVVEGDPFSTDDQTSSDEDEDNVSILMVERSKPLATLKEDYELSSDSEVENDLVVDGYSAEAVEDIILALRTCEFGGNIEDDNCEYGELDIEKSFIVEAKSEKKENSATGGDEDVVNLLKTRMKEFVQIPENLESEAELIEQERIIVSIEKLKELKGQLCTTLLKNGTMCGAELVFECSGKGTTLILSWKCDSKHSGKWCSSEVLTRRVKRDIYLNDLLLTTSVLISGNNWKKVELLFKFMNIRIPVDKVFTRNQNLFACPEISVMWNEMVNFVNSSITGLPYLCICGDARNDSPGHCAKYCTYVMMEHDLKLILDIEVKECRETKGVSPNMEREAFASILERLVKVVKIDEITTDASYAIINTFKTLQEKYPDLKDTFHSLDTWHKSKSVRKMLHNAAKIIGNEEILPWIDAIVNHFWFCSENCGGDPDTMKDMWISLLHHVCGEHEWAGGQCLHGPLTEEEPKTPLEKSSKAMNSLRDVVLDPRLLKSLHFYTRFRHTSDIENFNSMMLKYAPKRSAFGYMYYIARMQLAGLDHNIHAFREVAASKSGNELLYRRKYLKRSKNWHAEEVKTEKTYPHILLLLSRVLKRRINYIEKLDRPYIRSPDDPKLISPTIAMVEPPPTNMLVEQGRSRKRKFIITDETREETSKE